MLTVCLAVGTVGHFYCCAKFAAEVHAEGLDDPEFMAREVLDELVAYLGQTNSKSIEIMRNPEGVPYAQIGFKSKNGSSIVCFEENGVLYLSKNGVTQRALNDVLSIMFLPPSKTCQFLHIELNVWRKYVEKNGATTATISRYIEI